MKKLLSLILMISLLLGAVSAAAADGAAPSYVPARDNSDLYQDMGLHFTEFTNSEGVEYEAVYYRGSLRALGIELEEWDGTEYEVIYDEEGKIVYAEYETDSGEIYFDGTSWYDAKGAAVDGPDLWFMKKYADGNAITETWYHNNTMGLVGLSLRDMYPKLTDKWYQVVPVDLTKEGEFRLTTAASNIWFLGSCIVTIKDGTVTTDYTLPSGCADPKSDCLMWFTDIGDITTEFLNNPVGAYEFGKPVSIQDDLGGSEIALLFICNRLSYRVPLTDTWLMPVRYYRSNPRVEKILAEYEELFAKMNAQ